VRDQEQAESEEMQTLARWARDRVAAPF
jgi:hypothetical protein